MAFQKQDDTTTTMFMFVVFCHSISLSLSRPSLIWSLSLTLSLLLTPFLSHCDSLNVRSQLLAFHKLIFFSKAQTDQRYQQKLSFRI